MRLAFDGDVDEFGELLVGLGLLEYADDAPTPSGAVEVLDLSDDKYADTGHVPADFHAEAFGDRFRPLKRLKARVVAAVVARGGSAEEAEGAIREIGDGTFLDWLMNGGFEKIVELILKILGIFA